MLNFEPLIWRFDKSVDLGLCRASIGQQSEIERVGRDVHHLVEGDVMHPQQIRIDLHDERLDPLAPHGDVGDARERASIGTGSSNRPSSRGPSATLSFALRPIFMHRLVAESGWSMTGGYSRSSARPVSASCSRSCTNCLA